MPSFFDALRDAPRLLERALRAVGLLIGLLYLAGHRDAATQLLGFVVSHADVFEVLLGGR